MNAMIYGLRLIGDREVRYIGRTTRGLTDRFYRHVNTAQRMQSGVGLYQWLATNVGRVEIFEIATVEDTPDARRLEREMVEAAVSLGQRLFNQWLVPAKYRALAEAA